MIRLRLARFATTCSVIVMSHGLVAPAFAQVQIAPAATEQAPLPRLLETTLNDFRRLPSKDTLTWLLIGGAAASIGQTQDWDITTGFSKTSGRMGSMLKPGETIGGARVQLGTALATYAVGRITDKPRVTSLGVDLLRSQIVAQTLTAGIKLAVRRDRPDGGEFSFPSGHTSVTFATATVLQRHLGWKVGIPSYALASYVAASRVHKKRHFARDVAFGAAIGIVAGRTVTVGRGTTKFAVSPTVTPRAAGVSFTLLDTK